MDIEIGRGKRARRAYTFDDIAVVPSRRTRNPEDVSTNIGQLRETSLSTGAAASQVLTSSTELEQQASVLKSQVDEFLSHVRAA